MNLRRRARRSMIAPVLAFCCAIATGTTETAAQDKTPGDERALHGAQDVLTIARGLVNDDPSVRRDAAQACASHWPDGARAVPALLQALDDEDEGVRSAAEASLDALAGKSIAALSAFLTSAMKTGKAGLTDDDAASLEALLRRFCALGAGVVAKDLSDSLASTPNSSQRGLLAVAAGQELAYARTSGQEVVIPLIDDPELADLAAATVAWSAAWYARSHRLARPAPPSEAPAPWLAALGDARAGTRWTAARLLATWGRAGPKSIKVVTDALNREVGRDDAERYLISDLALALGVVSDPTVVVAAGLPGPLASDKDAASGFGVGLCRFASAEEASRLLNLPCSASPASLVLAGASAVPPASESRLRTLVLADGGPEFAAAVALCKLDSDTTELVRALESRVEAATRAGDPRIAHPLLSSLFLLGGGTPERGRALLKAVQASPWMASSLRGSCRATGSAADGVLAVLRPLAERRSRGWEEIASALGTEGGEFAHDLIVEAQPVTVPAYPSSGTERGRDAMRQHLAANHRVTALRALVRLGPGAAGVLPDLEKLRDDADPRIALLAARAARAAVKK